VRADHAGAAEVEAKHLAGLAILVATEPRRRPDLTPPLALLAGRLAREELNLRPWSADAWQMLGICSLALGAQGPAAVPDPTAPMTPARQSWDPIQSLSYAQAAYNLRQALQRSPNDFAALETLRTLMHKRGMLDSALDAARRLAQLRPRTSRQSLVLSELNRQLPDLERQVAESKGRVRNRWKNLDELAADLNVCLDHGLLETALSLLGPRFEEVQMPWELADRFAGVCMHLGYPDRARRVWQKTAADTPAARARTWERIGSSYLAEGRCREALDAYRKSLDEAPDLVDAHWGLARVYMEVGDAKSASEHSQAGLRLARRSTERQAFEDIRRLVEPYARSDG